MRFKQFLIESQSQISASEMNDILSTIKRDCAPFLQEMQGVDFSKHMLYRGVSTLPLDPFSVKHVRQDRRPLDTSNNAHTTADDWFFQNFGFRARSQSVFVTPNKKFAKRYGSPYVVFPIGQYKYIWSDEATDLFLDLRGKTDEDITNFLESANYNNHNLPIAVNADGMLEVMVYCKSYYLIDSRVWDDIMYINGADALK